MVGEREGTERRRRTLCKQRRKNSPKAERLELEQEETEKPSRFASC